MRTNRLLVGAFVLIAAIALIAVYRLFATHAENAANRDALLRIYDAIQPEDGFPEVLKAYWNYRTDDLSLTANKPDAWYIFMPLEFGAKDWRLEVRYIDGKVATVLMRTTDGPAPEDGPSDKSK